MKFAQRLDAILQQPQGEGREKDILQWNADIEKILFQDPKERKQMLDEDVTTEVNNPDQAKQQLDGIASKLEEEMIATLAVALGIGSSSDKEDQLKLVGERCQEHTGDTSAIADSTAWKRLEHLVQTSSNFFRWYLQVFLQTYPFVYPMVSKPFQSSSMLKIQLFLIEYNAEQEDDHHQQQTEENTLLSPSQRFARYASLLMFYATFSPRSPDDEEMQQTHNQLVGELKFIPKVLSILTYPTQTSAALALSLIRNIHNLLASFSGAIQSVQQTGFKYDETTAKAPWCPKPDDNTDGLISYPSVFRDILIWCLSSSPEFPGPSDDKRPELVVEILGIIFAMGGTEVSRALRHPCPNAALSQLVVSSLQFESEDPRIYQVKLSTITILTDASPSFGTYMIEQKALPALLKIAEHQIDTVIEQTKVDDTAFSALVPSLAALYRFSAGNPTFREATKDLIFPPSQEDHFWELAKEQLSNDSSNANANKSTMVPAAKNMHPLDAPRGSLRCKLIRLMTWTESHIKRYASELLWALCDEDPKEFVLRTGLGNAMGFLGSKGLVQLPAHALK